MAEKPEPSGKLPSRQIFLSHAHADRELANDLGTLVEQVFSGLVTVFSSTDPAPAGGIRPGEEWYPKIHSELGASESAWVLVTRTSITHPWLYWEAGIARAICPGGVAVIRVGIEMKDVPSPLNILQTYDGLNGQGEGIAVMLMKIGESLGMKINDQLISAATESWIEKAKNYEPIPIPDGQTAQLAPESLDRLDAAITRLESATSRSERHIRRSPGRSRGSGGSEEIAHWLRRLTAAGFIEDADEMRSLLDAAPPTTSFRVRETDEDGDIPIDVESSDGELQRTLYVRGRWLDHWTPAPSDSVRLARLMQDVRAKWNPVDPDDLPFE